MNKIEFKALEWLKKEGYTDITFRSRTSPDFITGQGISFEVKHLDRKRIYFSLTQLLSLQSIPQTIILVFDSNDYPLAQFPFSDISDKRNRWGTIHISYGSNNTSIKSIFKCLRCGHEWASKQPHPRNCPNQICRTRLWDKVPKRHRCTNCYHFIEFKHCSCREPEDAPTNKRAAHNCPDWREIA